jgi:hypothetical protein
MNKGQKRVATAGDASSKQERPRAVKQGVHPDLVTVKPRAGGAAGGNVPGFHYSGGPVVENPQVYNVFLGDWSSQANQTRVMRLNQFVADLIKSDYMKILTQYGCGDTGQFVKQVPVANANHVLSDSGIHSILQGAINAGGIPEPNNHSNVYILFLDDATGVKGSITMCEPTSDNAFGYHNFFTTAANNPCYYAVIPGLTNTCLQNSCPNDNTCSLHLAQTQEQRQTQVISHEFSEMISDPQLNAWLDVGGNENGDICNGNSGPITVGPNTWNVQRMYSKLDDMISNGATTCITGLPVLPVVPLARYWNPGATDHFYTTELNELSYNNQGWHLEGIQCYTFHTPAHGRIPLYRYWNPQISDHFYTTNWNELGAGAHGWTFERIQGYVYAVHHTGTVPLYRYWNASVGDHFYTTNWNELGAGASGWVLEGTQCYVYPGLM